jgi:hypothetical protein
MVQWYRNADMKMYYNGVEVADTDDDGLRRTGKGSYYHNDSSSYMSGSVTFSTSAASGGQSGDIWFQYS